jgi:hypothetical protein
MRDPLFRWPEPFPYDQLRRFGISPTSTQKEINNVGFDLLEDGSTQEREAWDQLRLVRSRLFVDFFFYQMEDEHWPDPSAMNGE